MSEAYVTKWINLNKIKFDFTQTHRHNFWAPLTTQVEELERTTERICHIISKPIQNTGCEKSLRTVKFILPPNHHEKTADYGDNNHKPQHWMETSKLKKKHIWTKHKLGLVSWMGLFYIQSVTQGPHQSQGFKQTPLSSPIGIPVKFYLPKVMISQATRVEN